MKWVIWELKNKSDKPDRKHLVPVKLKEGKDKTELINELSTLLAKDTEFCMRCEDE